MTATQPYDPGLRVQIRYKDRRSAAHFWRYPSLAAQRAAITDLLENEQCIAIDRCLIRRPLVHKDRHQIDTGCAIFDRQHQLATTGNVISNTIVSWIVRPYSRRQCNGITFAPGELFRKDIAVFQKLMDPHRLAGALFQRQDDSIVYAIFHTSGSGGSTHRVLHGALITDAATHKRLRQLSADELIAGGRRYGRSPYSGRIMEAVTPWLTDEIARDLESVMRRATLPEGEFA